MAVMAANNFDFTKRQPSCILAHNLINKLTAIIGGCELLEEESEASSACVKRLQLIRDVAKSMADDLRQHQCYLDSLARVRVMASEADSAHEV